MGAPAREQAPFSLACMTLHKCGQVMRPYWARSSIHSHLFARSSNTKPDFLTAPWASRHPFPALQKQLLITTNAPMAHRAMHNSTARKNRRLSSHSLDAEDTQDLSPKTQKDKMDTSLRRTSLTNLISTRRKSNATDPAVRARRKSEGYKKYNEQSRHSSSRRRYSTQEHRRNVIRRSSIQNMINVLSGDASSSEEEAEMAASDSEDIDISDIFDEDGSIILSSSDEDSNSSQQNALCDEEDEQPKQENSSRQGLFTRSRSLRFTTDSASRGSTRSRGRSSDKGPIATQRRGRSRDVASSAQQNQPSLIQRIARSLSPASNARSRFAEGGEGSRPIRRRLRVNRREQMDEHSDSSSRPMDQGQQQFLDSFDWDENRALSASEEKAFEIMCGELEGMDM